MHIIGTTFNDVIFIDGWFYGASNIYNKLYRFNEQACECLGEFPILENKYNMFAETRLIGSRICFLPYKSNYISFYDIKTSSFSIKKLNHDTPFDKFYSCFESEEYLYLLPYQYKAIIRIGKGRNDIEEVLLDGLDDAALMTYSFYYRDDIRSFKYTSNIIYDVNVNSLSVRKREEPRLNWISGYYYDGENEYFLQKDVMSVYLKNGDWVEINLPFQLTGALVKMIKIDDYIIGFPMYNEVLPDNIVVFDTNKMIFTSEFKDVFGSDKEVCSFAKIIGRNIVWDSLIRKALVVYDFDSGNCREIKIKQNYSMRRESNSLGIKDFIRYVEEM